MDKIYLVAFYDKDDENCENIVDIDDRFWTDPIQAQKFVDLWNEDWHDEYVFCKLKELTKFQI